MQLYRRKILKSHTLRKLLIIEQSDVGIMEDINNYKKPAVPYVNYYRA